MEYGEILQDIRKDNYLTQEDVAKILKISRSTYKDYEVINRVIPLKYLIILCNYFKISLDYVLGLTKNQNYSFIKNNNFDNDLFKIRFKEFRKNIKLSQKDLAIFLNTSHSMISDYENGKKIISTSFLYALCKNYHISADYLLGRIDKPKYLE